MLCTSCGTPKKKKSKKKKLQETQTTKICFHAKLLPALNKIIQYNMATVHTKDIFTVMYTPIHTHKTKLIMCGN